MAKKGGSFWDNPFGGFFDFNGDGKEDFAEQLFALQLLEMYSKENDRSSDFGSSYHSSSILDDDSSIDTSWLEFCEDGSEFGIDPNDYDTEDEYNEVLEKAKIAWRDTCEDGSEFGIDPEDYDTEDEYNEALAEAKVAWRDACEDGSEFGIDPEDYDTEDEYNEALEDARNNESEYTASIHFPINLSEEDDDKDHDESEEINETDYPNKRRYNAAYALANEYTYHSDDEYDKRKSECCRFILDNADTLIAANYLDHEGGFLYAQAVKDHFKLPVSLPDEDASREFEFSQIICKIAKRDIALSFEVWNWCFAQFLPYVKYDEYAASDLTNAVIDDLSNFPKNYRIQLLRYTDRDTDFRDKLLESCIELAEDLPELIVDAIQDGLFQTAEAFFRSALRKARGQWKTIHDLTKNVINYCKNYDELETIEHFRTNLFPFVKAIQIGMVQDEIEEWEQDMDQYINDVEDDCEKYAFSRKNAWRATVPDGKEYGLDPLCYDTEQAYMDALNEEKYGWREWYRDRDICGLSLDAFETQDAFREALHAKQDEKHRKEREEQQKRREAQRQAQIASERAAMNDSSIYIYCGVVFPFSSRPYSYRTEDTTIQIGDTVVVPLGEDQKETKGTVVSVGQYLRIAAPYPVERTKFILRKCTEKPL